MHTTVFRRTILFILAATVTLSYAAGEDEDRDREDEEKRIFDVEVLLEEFHSLEGEESIEVDTNDNGSIDYLYKTHESGEKRAEVLDYNHDGKMDDFYYYDEGVLQRREIDSNGNGRIDIWVHLDEGVYVKKFERDSNHNGEVDVEKDYEEEAEQREMER
ncbi:MAG: hypothetical protein ACLFNZ_01970 [Spirochaetaceae bacterium]